jgi:hypothetical protein
VPRIKRDDGRVKMILPPFAGELNGFTLLKEPQNLIFAEVNVLFMF